MYGNTYFTTTFYYYNNISIFEAKCLNNSTEVFRIEKDKMKVLLKQTIIRKNMEEYIVFKSKLFLEKLVQAKESMLSFIETIKVEEPQCSIPVKYESFKVSNTSAIKERLRLNASSTNYIETPKKDINEQSSFNYMSPAHHKGNSNQLPSFSVTSKQPFDMAYLRTELGKPNLPNLKGTMFQDYVETLRKSAQLHNIECNQAFTIKRESLNLELQKPKSNTSNFMQYKLLTSGELQRKAIGSKESSMQEVNWHIFSKNYNCTSSSTYHKTSTLFSEAKLQNSSSTVKDLKASRSEMFKSRENFAKKAKSKIKEIESKSVKKLTNVDLEFIKTMKSFNMHFKLSK